MDKTPVHKIISPERGDVKTDVWIVNVSLWYIYTIKYSLEDGVSN